MNFIKACTVFVSSYLNDPQGTMLVLKHRETIVFQDILTGLIKSMDKDAAKDIPGLQGCYIQLNQHVERLDSLKLEFEFIKHDLRASSPCIFVEYLEEGEKQSVSLVGFAEIQMFIDRAERGLVTLI